MSRNVADFTVGLQVNQDSVAEVCGIANELNCALSAAEGAIKRLAETPLNVDIVLNRHVVEEKKPTPEEAVVRSARGIFGYCIRRECLCDADPAKLRPQCPFLNTTHRRDGYGCMFVDPPSQWPDHGKWNSTDEPRS